MSLLCLQACQASAEERLCGMAGGLWRCRRLSMEQRSPCARLLRHSLAARESLLAPLSAPLRPLRDCSRVG